MSMLKEKFKGTYFISFISITTAICEFGISSIFILFLLYILNFSHPLASETYAYYYGIAYLFPIFIGYLSDKYLTKTGALTIGFITMIISQLSLAFSASLYVPSTIQYDHYISNLQNLSFLIGLFCLALGVSFTNISISHIINSVNKTERLKIDGLSIYYPILNIGVIIGVILMSLIIGDKNYYLYKWGFLTLAFILIIGLIIFRLLKNKYLVDNDGKLMEDNKKYKNPIKKESLRVLSKKSSKSIQQIKNLNLKEKVILYKQSLTKVEKDKLVVFFIFLVFIIIYRISYTQTTTSMIFFIDNYVDRNISFFNIPVQFFSILNPLFVLILGPIFLKINYKLEEKKIEFGIVKRIILALIVLAIVFMILSGIGYYIDIDAVSKINLLWMPLIEIIIAISELLFSIAGYSMIGDLTYEKYYSLFFGLFIATGSISRYMSGLIAIEFPVYDTPKFVYSIPIDGVMEYYCLFVFMNLVAAAVLIIYRKKITEKMHIDES